MSPAHDWIGFLAACLLSAYLGYCGGMREGVSLDDPVLEEAWTLASRVGQ